ncbi:MAG: hypothetical protein IJW31_08425 [Lentisphaeria bacterium]|nr:hypothetical protein [Lentisphaeria bacterium]
MLKKQQIFSLSLLAMASTLFADVANLGSDRELFVDNQMIEKMDNAEIKLHSPIEREITFKLDQPHEGNCSCYFTIFKDGDKYRMYYNGGHFAQWGIIGTARKQHPEFTCLAESTDGINWTRPILNKVEFNGSKANNIVPVPARWTHCFTPFKDTNPDCPADEIYKAVAFDHGAPKQLFGFVSPDGINWKLVSDKAIITGGNFDSQNLVFYDNARGLYVAYYRKSPQKNRGIATATSKDFINWTEGKMLSYGGKDENFYTNAIMRYGRAPYLLGFPMLFRDGRLYPGNLGIGVGDGGFMSSRDGENFYLFEEAFLRPGLNRERWYNRNNYAAWGGLIETPTDIPGGNKELSLYFSEGYFEGREVNIRRCTLRIDGFASIHAGAKKGTVLTTPLTFKATPDNEVKEAPKDPLFTPITIDRGPSIKGKITHFGNGVFRASKPTSLEIPETQNLGKTATFALQTDYLSRGGERRFFSSNDKQPGGWKACFHIYLAPNKNQHHLSLVRFAFTPFGKAEFGGHALEAEIAKQKNHHFAATVDHGKIKLYMNGKLVAENNIDRKDLDLNSSLGNIRFANDYPPNGMVNSPFIGYADDILILKRAMSAEEIAALAENGAEKTLDLAKEKGVLYTMETERAVPLIDRLSADGQQNATFPTRLPWGKTMLLLNCSTSARGSIRVELQDAETGKAILGYSLADCDVIYDDSLDRIVSWHGKSDVSKLAGKPIRILYELQDADIFAYRFGQ